MPDIIAWKEKKKQQKGKSNQECFLLRAKASHTREIV